MKGTAGKLLVFAALAGLFALLYSQFGEYFTLEAMKAKRAEFAGYYEQNTFLVLGGFFCLYVVVTALSLPGAAIMTLLAGALFGLVAGVIVVSFASSMGATLAFFAARFLLGSSLQAKYGDKLQKINDGIDREGLFYLFTMRLIPAFPFFLINILMGLTRLPARSFYWVSQLGMLPGTIVYVNAGTELGKIDSLKGILSPGLIGAFVVLGLLPIVSKKIIAQVRKRRAG